MGGEGGNEEWDSDCSFSLNTNHAAVGWTLLGIIWGQAGTSRRGRESN